MSLNVETTGALPRQTLPWRLGIGRLTSTWVEVVVVFTTVIAALVRLPTLGAKGFWYDELISVGIANESIGTILRARLSIGASQALIDQLYTNNPPLHLLLIHGMLQISPSETVVRFPFALVGIATVPLAYLVLSRLFSRSLAALGMALLAVSPIHIAYSQEARPSVLLVFLALLSLHFLLRALDDEGTRYWVAFAVTGAVACWTSYFAINLVIPTLGVVTFLLLAGRLRQSWPNGGLRVFLAPGLAFAGIVLSTLPLLPDLLMTAGRNDVGASPSLTQILYTISIAMLAIVGLSSPLPGMILASIPSLILTFLGLWTLIRKPDRRAAIIVAWIVTPIAMLGIISSAHFVTVRYILAMLPLTLVLPFVGISSLEQGLRQAFSPRAVLLVRFVLIGILFATYALGVRAYEDEYIPSGPTKRDWRGMVQLYRAGATTDSCLIVIDRVGDSIAREVPYYVDQDDRNLCAVDVRDPRLLDVISTHDDLWWGVSVAQDERARLADAFAETATVDVSTLVVLIRHVTETAASPELHAESTLQTMLTALTPRPEHADPSVGVRAGLANLYLLSGHSPASVAEFLHDIGDPWGGGWDIQQWDSARRSLDRGEFAWARILGVRLIALYPGDPDTYDFLAEIEDRAGGTTGPLYHALADALRS